MSSSQDESAVSRRRADARRNIAAILDAAVHLLEERPDPTIGEIAETAGVTRQTVYAHYESREALLSAALDRAFDESVAAIDAARLEEGPATQALERLLQAGWETVELYTRILGTLHRPVGPDERDARHLDVMERLLRLLRRGQRAGEFDQTMPAEWLLAMVSGLIQAAAQQIAAGRMSSADANELVRRTILRAVAPG